MQVSRDGKLNRSRPFAFSVDCKWSEWAAWDSCSESCGFGTRQRSRNFSQEAAHGGSNCTGELVSTQVCNARPCRGRKQRRTKMTFLWPPYIVTPRKSQHAGGQMEFQMREAGYSGYVYAFKYSRLQMGQLGAVGRLYQNL